ncbi:hypothetical protein ID866_8310 [Astraeus odoratus]|nr:hypothetical protein ID866_8310 [Astraeus odoratus]
MYLLPRSQQSKLMSKMLRLRLDFAKEGGVMIDGMSALFFQRSTHKLQSLDAPFYHTTLAPSFLAAVIFVFFDLDPLFPPNSIHVFTDSTMKAWMIHLEFPDGHPWLVSFVEVLSLSVSLRTSHAHSRGPGRKLKCDGSRPSCGNCNRRGYPCLYVPVLGSLFRPP